MLLSQIPSHHLQIEVIKAETMESLLLILWLKSCSDTDE